MRKDLFMCLCSLCSDCYSLFCLFVPTACPTDRYSLFCLFVPTACQTAAVGIVDIMFHCFTISTYPCNFCFWMQHVSTYWEVLIYIYIYIYIWMCVYIYIHIYADIHNRLAFFLSSDNACYFLQQWYRRYSGPHVSRFMRVCMYVCGYVYEYAY